MDKRSFLILAGFLLFILPILGFIVNLVGVSLTIFKPIDELGFLVSSLIKLVLLTSGIVILYFQLVLRKKY